MPVKPGSTPFNVTVGNTIGQPVPVKQNGNWYVGLSGVPNIHIANNNTSPIPTTNRDEQGRNAFCEVISDSIQQGSGAQTDTLPAVQSGQRLIITHIGVYSVAGGSDIPASYGFLGKYPAGGSNTGSHAFGFTVPAGSSQVSIADLDCFLPINSSEVSYVTIQRADTAVGNSAMAYTIELEGYYVSLP